MKKKFASYITTILFLTLLFSLTVANCFHEKVDFSVNENRSLSSFPPLTFSNIVQGNFDQQFENCLSDHFPFRDAWIMTKAAVKKACGAIENNNVYFGEDNHLIKQELDYDKTTIQNNISYIQQFTEDNNIKANILLIPDACYGEEQLLPKGAVNMDEKEMIQSIQQDLQDQTIIDITDTIHDTKDTYFKTDHHWNENGALLGYEAICKDVLNKKPNTFHFQKVSDSFQGTMVTKSGVFWNEADKINKMECDIPFQVKVTYDNTVMKDSLFEEDNLQKKDQYTYYLDGNHALVDIKTNVKTKKKAVIVKDSYAHILLPYLASEYREIQVVDLRYYSQSTSSLLDKNTDFYVIYSLESFVNDNHLALLY